MVIIHYSDQEKNVDKGYRWMRRLKWCGRFSRLLNRLNKEKRNLHVTEWAINQGVTYADEEEFCMLKRCLLKQSICHGSVYTQ